MATALLHDVKAETLQITRFRKVGCRNSCEFAGLQTAPASHRARKTANTTFSCRMLQNAGFGTIPWGGEGGGVVANREPGSYIHVCNMFIYIYITCTYIHIYMYGLHHPPIFSDHHRPAHLVPKVHGFPGLLQWTWSHLESDDWVRDSLTRMLSVWSSLFTYGTGWFWGCSIRLVYSPTFGWVVFWG